MVRRLHRLDSGSIYVTKQEYIAKDDWTPRISISEEEFKEIYPEHLHDLYYLLVTRPETEEEFLEFYLPSKLWRLNNLYTIVNKHGESVPFVMNKSQHKVYAASLIHSRIIILKSRQQGISTF